MGFICSNCLLRHSEGEEGSCPYDSDVRTSFKKFDYRDLKKHNNCPTVASLKKADQEEEEKSLSRLIKECRNCKMKCSTPISQGAKRVDIRHCKGFAGYRDKELLASIFKLADEKNLVNELMICFQIFVTDGDGVLKTDKPLYIGEEKGKQFISISGSKSSNKLFPEDFNYKAKKVTIEGVEQTHFEPI